MLKNTRPQKWDISICKHLIFLGCDAKVKIFLRKSLELILFAMNNLSHSSYLVRLRVTQSQGLWLSLSILKLFPYPLKRERLKIDFLNALFYTKPYRLFVLFLYNYSQFSNYLHKVRDLPNIQRFLFSFRQEFYSNGL